MPDSGRRADRAIDHQQDRAEIDPPHRLLVPLHPRLEPALQRPGRRGTAAAAAGRSRRRRSPRLSPWACSRSPTSRGVSAMPMMLDSEALHSAAATLPPATEVKITEACTVDGRRAEEQQADIERRRDQRARHRPQRQPEQREDDEGRGEDHQMQPPVQDAGQHRGPRQPRALQEEQQARSRPCWRCRPSAPPRRCRARTRRGSPPPGWRG